MTAALQAAVLVLAIVPHSPTVEDRVSIIEHNRYFSGDGKLVFAQLIFIDFIEGEDRIVTYLLVKDGTALPEFNHATGMWELRFRDGDVMRKVVADSVRDSWTQEYYAGDPELEARRWFPRERRRGLTIPLKTNSPIVSATGP